MLSSHIHNVSKSVRNFLGAFHIGSFVIHSMSFKVCFKVRAHRCNTKRKPDISDSSKWCSLHGQACSKLWGLWEKGDNKSLEQNQAMNLLYYSWTRSWTWAAWLHYSEKYSAFLKSFFFTQEKIIIFSWVKKIYIYIFILLCWSCLGQTSFWLISIYTSDISADQFSFY